MGIKGLLPFLKCITKDISLSEIRKSTVAVDTYCWLHKAVLCCSDKIALGEDTDVYLSYCTRYLKLLLSYDIKVILVFDGKNLPAKSDVENKRQENRENFHKKGMMFTMERRLSEAKECFAKCVEISHKIAVKLIMKARQMGVKSIVAPYEADAQLAYLCRKNIVDYVITEDSDLLLFGTPKVLFKLDFNGRACLIERNDINKALKFPIEKYSFTKFRYICIISGCDYFPGINGVGLITAAKMIQKTQLIELSDFLARINMYSKNKIIISQDEINQAIKADLTFQYQIVFDPINIQQVPLNDYPVGLISSNLEFAGKILEDQDLVWELAAGKRDPTNYELVPNFDLDSKLLNSSDVFYFGISHHHNLNHQQNLNEKKTLDTPHNKAKSVQVKCQFPWKDASKSSESEIDFSKIFEGYFDENISDTKRDQLCQRSRTLHISESAPQLKNLQFEKSASDNSSHLDNVLSKEESLVLPNSDDKITVPPFPNDSIIRNKRSFQINSFKSTEESGLPIESLKRSRTLHISESAPQLSGKKILIQSKLSHLFKPKNSNIE